MHNDESNTKNYDHHAEVPTGSSDATVKLLSNTANKMIDSGGVRPSTANKICMD